MKKTSWIVAAVLLGATSAHAGPNAGAGLFVDFLYTTARIDSVADPRGKSDLWVGIVAQGVSNLDAFNVDIVIDTSVLAYRGFMKDNQMQGVANLLEKNGGSALVFVAGAPDTNSTAVTILGTLQGEDTAVAAEGSGILALVHLTIKREAATFISLRNAKLKDPLSPADSITLLGNGRLALTSAAMSAPLHRSADQTRGTMWRATTGTYDLRGRLLSSRSGPCGSELARFPVHVPR